MSTVAFLSVVALLVGVSLFARIGVSLRQTNKLPPLLHEQ
jgi:hypothetical protein